MWWVAGRRPDYGLVLGETLGFPSVFVVRRPLRPPLHQPVAPQGGSSAMIKTKSWKALTYAKWKLTDDDIYGLKLHQEPGSELLSGPFLALTTS